MARKDKVQKTNAMRELEVAGVAYEAIAFEEPDPSGTRDLGVQIAHMLGHDPLQGFKTLVCAGPAGAHVVCCIPSSAELDLNRAWQHKIGHKASRAHCLPHRKQAYHRNGWSNHSLM